MGSNVAYGNDVTLSVKETASGSNAADGCMYSTADVLGSALVLAQTAVTPTIVTDTTLSAGNQVIYTLDAAGTATVDFDYEQVIGIGDTAATDYGILITFTGAIIADPSET